MRQDHGGPRDPAPHRADGRRLAPRRPRHHPSGQDGAQAVSPADADHLPGPVLLAQPAHARRRHRGRAAQDPRHLQQDGAARAGGAAVRSRGAAQGADGQLPAPVLRRPAPAHRRGPGAGAQSKAHHLRRAGLRARRVDPGAGHQSADGPAARYAARLICSSRTTWPWWSTSATALR